MKTEDEDRHVSLGWLNSKLIHRNILSFITIMKIKTENEFETNLSTLLHVLLTTNTTHNYYK